MRLFCDCEFNSALGGLISMALVGEDATRVFYEVVEITEPVDPWVKDNVMTVLEKKPISYTEFQFKLLTFLKQFAAVTIIADHPEDIVRVCRALIISGGKWMEVWPIQFEADDRLSAKAAKVRHNAYHDAVAMRESWFKLNGYTQAE